MYAIVEACGRQYQLEAGKFVDIDLVPVEPGQEFVFDRVLMLVDGKDSQVGEPYVSGAKVTGKVLAHDRDSKIIVYKMRPKKGTRKKQGHRQGYTRVLVSQISVNDKVLAEARGDKKPAREKPQPEARGAEKPAARAVKKPAARAAEAPAAERPAKTAGKPAAKPARKAATKPVTNPAEKQDTVSSSSQD